MSPLGSKARRTAIGRTHQIRRGIWQLILSVPSATSTDMTASLRNCLRRLGQRRCMSAPMDPAVTPLPETRLGVDIGPSCFSAVSPNTSAPEIEKLAAEIRSCRLCAASLPRGPRPVLRFSSTARLLIAAQAPGWRVHESGLPFHDPSGDRLRAWLGLDRATFYDTARVALVPMGFCYPGKGKAGDLPPRPECAETWRARVLAQMRSVQFTLVIGQYAQAWHLGPQARATLTETVRAWRSFYPQLVPLPHPSPRNNLWLRRNPWFEAEVLPAVRAQVARVLEERD